MTPGNDDLGAAKGICADSPAGDAALVAHLCALIDAGDTAAVVAALGELARLRGMSQVARDTGLSREALYRALRAHSFPRFDTIVRVCAALDLKLRAHPARAAC
jgi:probable addiction module antidote protein